jgi:ubiquinone/menaquinone biosynthesis C-methylase UbiE
MSIHGDNYVLKADRSGHDRLRMICRIHDPDTQDLLRKAGLTPGFRTVEFGCGLGTISRWIAAEGGAAIGIDLSDAQVEEARRAAAQAGITGVDYRVDSVYDSALPDGQFDIVSCRWLLVHLNRPVDAMKTMHRLLKPGGCAVCEEVDISGVYAEPSSEAYNQYREFVIKAGQARGVDYEGGRRLHLWAREAGFEVEHIAARHPHYVAGEEKGFWNWTLAEAGQSLIQARLLDAERDAQWRAGMTAADQDPGTLVAHARTHQIIARKLA